jgi:GTP-binding protein
MWDAHYFQVVDTGGILFDDKAGEVFAKHIRMQAEIALKECSVAMLVVDGQEGITNLDLEIARYLRKQAKPVYVAVNKCESHMKSNEQTLPFRKFGFGALFPVSGLHGSGLGDILDAIIEDGHLPKITKVAKENVTNVALVGRPNAGKSSLFNRLYGGERSIVSELPGTTRDSVDAVLTWNESLYRIIDTAGIRKKSKIPHGSEYLMVNRALKAIKRADVCLLVIDAPEGIKEQDRILSNTIAAEGRACIIVLNKWDVIPNKDGSMYHQGVEYVHEALPRIAWADVIMVSAKTGQRCLKIMEMVEKAKESHRRRYSTSVINQVLKDALLWQSPPTITSQHAMGRIYYATQTSTAPPSISLFCNSPLVRIFLSIFLFLSFNLLLCEIHLITLLIDYCCTLPSADPRFI